MWPYGFNSAWPGKPASVWYKRRTWTADGNGPLASKDVEEETWRDLLRKLQQDPDAVITEISRWSRPYLKKLLDWLLLNVATADKGAALLGLQHHILDLIKRQYISFIRNHQVCSCEVFFVTLVCTPFIQNRMLLLGFESASDIDPVWMPGC